MKLINNITKYNKLKSLIINDNKYSNIKKLKTIKNANKNNILHNNSNKKILIPYINKKNHLFNNPNNNFISYQNNLNNNFFTHPNNHLFNHPYNHIFNNPHNNFISYQNHFFTHSNNQFNRPNNHSFGNYQYPINRPSNHNNSVNYPNNHFINNQHNQNNQINHPNNQISQSSNKVLILYVTHEINDNVTFFCRKGYINNDNYQYLFIINDLNIKLTMLAQYNNIKILNRENIGYDFGAWSDGLFLKENGKYIYEKYDYFIFINSTVRGPFFPLWYDNNDWVNIFIKKINNNVKLFGTTINISNGHNNLYTPHVQSMFFVTDKIGLNILIKNNIFNNNNVIIDKKDIIMNKEIAMSTVIINEGYNIGCLLYAYKNINFKYPTWNYDKNNTINTDHCAPNNAYFGICINPYEVIFIKTNRNLCPEIVDKYTEWHLK